MKVLHVIYGFHRAGAEVMVRDLALRLQERGRWKPIVAALHSGPEDLRTDLEEAGIPTEVLSGAPGMAQCLPALIRLIALCWRERPQVLHSHCEVPDLVARLASLVTGIPHVSTGHNVRLWPWRPRLGAWLERLLRWRTSHHIAVAEAVAATLKGPVSLIPNVAGALDSAPVDPGFGPGKRVVLVVARVDRQKGPDVMLEALERLDFPDLRVLWVGEGPMRSAMQAKAGNLPIRFDGARSDVPGLLQTCEIFCLPSRWEGLPVALLEALKARKPAIATAVGGVPEVLHHEENGLLIPPEDPAALAEAIARLLRDGELAAKLAAAPREQADPQKAAEEHEAIYDRVRRPRREWWRRAALYAGYRLKLSRQPVLPVALDIEPANTCNFRCPHCQVTHWSKERAQLTQATFQRVLDQFPALTRVKLQGMGEPLLNRQLIPMLEQAEARDLDTSFITNGSILTKDQAARLVRLNRTRITFSLDGASAETFESMRPGSRFQQVCDNLRTLTQARGEESKPRIEVWTVVTRTNEHELADIVRLAHSLGADAITLQPFVSDWGKESMRPHAEAARTVGPDLETARAAAREVGIPLTVYAHNLLSRQRKCDWPWTSAYVAANGDVVPCCVVADADTARMGNLFEQPFAEIWNGPAYRELRRRIREHDLPHYCRNCYRDP